MFTKGWRKLFNLSKFSIIFDILWLIRVDVMGPFIINLLKTAYKFTKLF